MAKIFSVSAAKVTQILCVSLGTMFAAPLWGQSAENGPDRLTETFRDWVVQCATRDTASGTVRSCQMVQELTRESDGGRVLNMSIRQNQEAQGIVQITVPLGVLLAQGVRISVEEQELARIGYLTCVQGGCIARGILEPSVVDVMQQSGEAQVTIQGSEPISIGISLMGFTAAWDRIIELGG